MFIINLHLMINKKTANQIGQSQQKVEIVTSFKLRVKLKSTS